jgi:putative MFS transporter
MALGSPVGGVIGMLCSDKIGRKRGIVWFSILAMIFGAIYANVKTPEMIMFVGFCVVTVSYVLVALIVALYLPEMFPTDLRMRGVAFCNTLGRLATIATPYVVVTIYNEHEIGGVLTLMIALLAIQTLVVAFFGIETKARSLEELVPDGDEAVVQSFATEQPRV